MQKETDVVFAQHVPHARRQQIHLLRVVVQKFRHRASPRRSIEDVSNRVFTQTLKPCPDGAMARRKRAQKHLLASQESSARTHRALAFHITTGVTCHVERSETSLGEIP